MVPLRKPSQFGQLQFHCGKPPPAPAAIGAAARPATAQPPLVRDYAPAQSHSVLVLQAALAEHHGNQSRAAQSLGLTLRQFSYRLRKAGLK